MEKILSLRIEKNTLSESTEPVRQEAMVKKRRTKAERRGILEEAIDYFLEHPSCSQAEIERIFHLERGALSKENAQILIENRKPKQYKPRRKE